MSLLSLTFAALMTVLAPPSVLAAAQPLDWDRELSPAGSPPLVHAQVHYVDAAGKPHVLELVRQGERRLVRRTDGAVELQVERRAGGEYSYALADRARARLLLVNRTNLYRIGVMSDFASLSTLVSRPATAHVLTASARPSETAAPGACRWLHLEITGGPRQPAREICWSDRWRLPLHIDVQRGSGWARVLDVDRVDAAADPRALRVSAAGLTVIHVDDDIDPAQDM